MIQHWDTFTNKLPAPWTAITLWLIFLIVISGITLPGISEKPYADRLNITAAWNYLVVSLIWGVIYTIIGYAATLYHHYLRKTKSNPLLTDNKPSTADTTNKTGTSYLLVVFEILLLPVGTVFGLFLMLWGLSLLVLRVSPIPMLTFKICFVLTFILQCVTSIAFLIISIAMFMRWRSTGSPLKAHSTQAYEDL